MHVIQISCIPISRICFILALHIQRAAQANDIENCCFGLHAYAMPTPSLQWVIITLQNEKKKNRTTC